MEASLSQLTSCRSVAFFPNSQTKRYLWRLTLGFLAQSVTGYFSEGGGDEVQVRCSLEKNKFILHSHRGGGGDQAGRSSPLRVSAGSCLLGWQHSPVTAHSLTLWSHLEAHVDVDETLILTLDSLLWWWIHFSFFFNQIRFFFNDWIDFYILQNKCQMFTL